MSFTTEPRKVHYIDVIMTTIASQITSLTVVYLTVYSDADKRKHQSFASLPFVRGIHRDRWIPRTKGQLCGKCFHLMTSSCKIWNVQSNLRLTSLGTSDFGFERLAVIFDRSINSCSCGKSETKDIFTLVVHTSFKNTLTYTSILNHFLHRAATGSWNRYSGRQGTT